MAERDVDAYIGALEEPQRRALDALRTAILEVVPGAEQTIAYGAPAFEVGGKRVAGFAAATHHLSYLPHSGSVLADLADDVAGFQTSKGALRFTPDHPPDAALVRKLVEARLRELGLDAGGQSSPP